MPLVEQSDSGDRCSFRLRRVGTPASFPGISDTFKINKEITVVGRNPSSSDIFLDSNKSKVMISRLHARIITEKDNTGKHNFRISDTSLNGTYVNDVKVADSCELQPGDTVTFGHLRGAVLPPGTLAQQPESEFRFTFERYPSTPPNKKQKCSEDQVCFSPEFQRKTPSPQSRPQPLKLGPKTPLFPAANMHDLSAFLTPGTPAHELALTGKCRLPDSIQGKQSWRQHFVSEHSDLEHSDDELIAYAAAAGEAMDDSDEDIFSLQLPDSPELSDEAGTSSERTDLHVPANVSTATTSHRPSLQVNKECTSKRSKGKEEHKSPNKKANKRPRKSPPTNRKAARKSSKISNSRIDQPDDDFMYNTCASVDCIHPHDKHKLVSWVQCDDCDDWFHVMCTGLSLKSVQPKSAKFHCGCV